MLVLGAVCTVLWFDTFCDKLCVLKCFRRRLRFDDSESPIRCATPIVAISSDRKTELLGKYNACGTHFDFNANQPMVCEASTVRNFLSFLKNFLPILSGQRFL